MKRGQQGLYYEYYPVLARAREEGRDDIEEGPREGLPGYYQRLKGRMKNFVVEEREDHKHMFDLIGQEVRSQAGLAGFIKLTVLVGGVFVGFLSFNLLYVFVASSLAYASFDVSRRELGLR